MVGLTPKHMHTSIDVALLLMRSIIRIRSNSSPDERIKQNQQQQQQLYQRDKCKSIELSN